MNSIISKIKIFFSIYLLFEVICMFCIYANIIYTHTVIMALPSWYYIFYPEAHIFFFILEGCLIYFISYIYPPKRHIILLLVYFISTMILWINVGYSRYFNTYMPLSLYTEFNNLNGLLPNIYDAIDKYDLFFLINSLIIVGAFFFFGKKEKPIKCFLLPSIFVVMLLFSFLLYYQSIKKEHDFLAEHFVELNDNRTVWDTMVTRWHRIEQTIPESSLYYYYGISPTLIINGLETICQSEPFHFSDEEKQELKKYVNTKDNTSPKDTVKNLIFIIVESLSSYPICKSFGGVELTPNLNKLTKDAFYNPNMLSETQLGNPVMVNLSI